MNLMILIDIPQRYLSIYLNATYRYTSMLLIHVLDDTYRYTLMLFIHVP